jgi:hypothetical protein
MSQLKDFVGLFFMLIILIILSAFSGYWYGKLKFEDNFKSADSIHTEIKYIPYVFPADTIKEVKIKTHIFTKNIIDSTEINSLLDTIESLYNRLEKLEVKQLATLDTIFPQGDSIYIEFDKVSDVWNEVILRKKMLEIPYEIRTIYMPCPPTHSIWVDLGIGIGSFGVGYLIGNVNAK